MKNLMDEQVKDYLRTPVICPWCRSTDILGGGPEYDPACDPALVVARVSCNICHAEWSDVYKLVGIETDDRAYGEV